MIVVGFEINDNRDIYAMIGVMLSGVLDLLLSYIYEMLRSLDLILV